MDPKALLTPKDGGGQMFDTFVANAAGAALTQQIAQAETRLTQMRLELASIAATLAGVRTAAAPLLAAVQAAAAAAEDLDDSSRIAIGYAVALHAGSVAHLAAAETLTAALLAAFPAE